jgi:hypothetical protein
MAKKPAGEEKPVKKELRKPPELPAGGGTSRKPPVSAGKAAGGFNAKAVMDNPSADALGEQILKSLGG